MNAAGILMLLAVAFALFGTVVGVITRGEAQKAKERLQLYADDEVMNIDGVEITIAELRGQIDFAVVYVFGANYLLALIMLGLLVWAKKSPFPAALIGLCVYLVVVVLEAVVEPASLVRGIVFKAFIVLGLLGGMQAALAEPSAGRMRHRGSRAAASGAAAGRARRARAR